MPVTSAWSCTVSCFASKLGEMAVMPLYWDVDPVLAVRGVKNVGRNAGGNTRNTSGTRNEGGEQSLGCYTL